MPTAIGRHCAACAKTVVDFTLKPDAENLAYLAVYDGRHRRNAVELYLSRSSLRAWCSDATPRVPAFAPFKHC